MGSRRQYLIKIAHCSNLCCKPLETSLYVHCTSCTLHLHARLPGPLWLPAASPDVHGFAVQYPVNTKTTWPRTVRCEGTLRSRGGQTRPGCGSRLWYSQKAPPSLQSLKEERVFETTIDVLNSSNTHLRGSHVVRKVLVVRPESEEIVWGFLLKKKTTDGTHPGRGKTRKTNGNTTPLNRTPSILVNWLLMKTINSNSLWIFLVLNAKYR